MEGSEDIPEFLRMIIALIFVVGLMGVFALALKKLGFSGAIEAAGKGEKRLKIVEVLPLDGRRRLALIQRDDVQHLVILGGNDETVIETGIKPPDNNTHDS